MSDYDSSEVDSDYSEHKDAEADLDDASMEDNDETEDGDTSDADDDAVLLWFQR